MKRIAAALMIFASGYLMKDGKPLEGEVTGMEEGPGAVAPYIVDDLRREVAELRSEFRSAFRSRVARLERATEFLVATGTVASGEAVPLPNGGRWRDGTPILPGHWVIAASVAHQRHTWRGTPKAVHCEIDQDSRVAKVYSEKWTYPGEGRDADGVANYTVICSRGLGRDTKAEVF